MPGDLNDKASIPRAIATPVDLINSEIAEIVLDRIFLAVPCLPFTRRSPFSEMLSFEPGIKSFEFQDFSWWLFATKDQP